MATLTSNASLETPSTTDKWRLSLFGALRAERGELSIDRFRSQKFGGLLAYLALYPSRHHSREALADTFWPDNEPEAARANVRSALASLRRQLEPPGTLAGSVVASMGRYQVGLTPGSFVTDVQLFENALTSASRASASPQEKLLRLEEASSLYVGPLLPGFYDEWVMGERDRLAAAHLRVLRELSALHESAGNFDLALDYARREVINDPLREDAHAELIRLLMRTEQKAAAQRHFHEMERLLGEQLGIQPTKQTRALLLATPEPLPTTRPRHPAPKIALENGNDTLPAPPTASSVSTVAAPTATLPNPVPTPPLRLPLTVARFFGREDEIDALSTLLRRPTTRLVTLTGPGGSGKTRLVVETARLHLGTSPDTDGPIFPGGIYFVPLAEVRDRERVPAVMAGVLGFDITPAQPALEQVIDALKAVRGRLLLLLDNAEHLVEQVAPLVHQLLEQVPHLVCLVTSRQRLLLEAEHEFPLLPLGTPRYPGSPDRLLEFACVQLFVSRAQAARADFQLSSHNADAVATLCARLEGIPLAIELAAAWSRTLTPQQMLDRMDRRFDLLVSRRRDISPRHRSLRATVEASVELLDADLCHFFAALSVFRGGWTLDAAEALSRDSRAADFLEQLQEHSLIYTTGSAQAEGGDTGRNLRFHMLETLREYAAEQLSADEQVELTTAHARFFDDLMEQGASPLFGPEQAAWIRRLSAEKDNLLAMLDTYDAPHGAEAGLRLTGRMWRFWSMIGSVCEGRARFARALARADESVPRSVHARARYSASVLAQIQGDYAVAKEYAEEARELWEADDYTSGVADALTHTGVIELNQAHYAEALRCFEQSLVHNRAIGEPGRLALLYNNLAACLQEWGKLSDAIPYLEECLPLARAAGMRHVEASALLNLGTIHHEQKNWEAARQLYEQSVQIRRESNDKQFLAHSLELLGSLAYDRGDLDGSLPPLAESLGLRRESRDLAGITDTQLARGLAYTALQEYPAALAALAESLQLAVQLKTERRVACGLEGLATLASAQGQNERAALLWGRAAALRTAIGIPLSPAEQDGLADRIAPVRALLGEDAFTAAWETGRNMTHGASLALALQGV